MKIVPIVKLLHLAANAEPPKTLQDAVVALKTVKSRQPVGGLFGLVVMFHHIFWRGCMCTYSIILYIYNYIYTYIYT